MDYKKFHDINAWLCFIGLEMSTALSIIMMFFSSGYVFINFMPITIFTTIAKIRNACISSYKDYDEEEHFRYIQSGEPVLNENPQIRKTVILIMAVSGCLTILLTVIKLDMH